MCASTSKRAGKTRWSQVAHVTSHARHPCPAYEVRGGGDVLHTQEWWNRVIGDIYASGKQESPERRRLSGMNKGKASERLTSGVTDGRRQCKGRCHMTSARGGERVSGVRVECKAVQYWPTTRPPRREVMFAHSQRRTHAVPHSLRAKQPHTGVGVGQHGPFCRDAIWTSSSAFAFEECRTQHTKVWLHKPD